MELKDFLLLLFNRNIDKYPEIRESFLNNFTPEQICNVLQYTNYIVSYKELRKCIESTYFNGTTTFMMMCPMDDIYSGRIIVTESIIDQYNIRYVMVTPSRISIYL